MTMLTNPNLRLAFVSSSSKELELKEKKPLATVFWRASTVPWLTVAMLSVAIRGVSCGDTRLAATPIQGTSGSSN